MRCITCTLGCTLYLLLWKLGVHPGIQHAMCMHGSAQPPPPPAWRCSKSIEGTSRPGAWRLCHQGAHKKRRACFCIGRVPCLPDWHACSQAAVAPRTAQDRPSFLHQCRCAAPRVIPIGRGRYKAPRTALTPQQHAAANYLCRKQRQLSPAQPQHACPATTHAWLAVAGCLQAPHPPSDSFTSPWQAKCPSCTVALLPAQCCWGSASPRRAGPPPPHPQAPRPPPRLRSSA